MFTFPQAIIFDMDGTLIDNMPMHIQVWTDYLRDLGAAVDPHAFHEQTAGKTNPEILRMYLGDDLTDEAAEQHGDEKERRYRSLSADAIRPLPGLEAFLKRARFAGCKLGLATSAGRENIAFVLERLGLAGSFHAVVSAEEVTLGKPDPQAFLLAAERLGVPPSGCVVFEDSVKGIEAAYRAGMPVVAVLTALSAERALSLPGVILAIQDYEGLGESG